METSKPHHSRSATAPSIISPISNGVQKHRRLSSAGGGRAWTEEEEAYLVRTRMHKMPYKHIAAHLHKTELACRLHYHQMSYGSNRRRRAESISSTTSSPYTLSSASEESSRKFKPTTELNAHMGPATPESQAYSRSPSISHSPGQSRAHVPILPKHNTSVLPPIRSASPEWNDPRKLHLDTSFAQTQKTLSSSDGHKNIDTARLRKIYDAHRDSFWSVIASEYSTNQEVTAQKLEEAFFQVAATSQNVITPPASPQSSSCTLPQPSMSAPAAHSANGYSGFSAINGPKLASIPEPQKPNEHSSPMEKCAVSSLLTVERDVWAPKEISTA